MPRRRRGITFPVKLNDNYTCQGIDAEGRAVAFDDLLFEGDPVATTSDDKGNTWGPERRVVRRDDGLWVE